MKVRYEPAKGAPLYAEGGPMSIDNPGVVTMTPVVSQSAKPAVAVK